MLGRDDQASSPLIDMLGGEQHGHPGHQCIATCLCEANQQQPCVSPRPETPHIREIQILRDQKAVSRLCCLPDLIVVSPCQVFRATVSTSCPSARRLDTRRSGRFSSSFDVHRMGDSATGRSSWADVPANAIAAGRLRHTMSGSQPESQTWWRLRPDWQGPSSALLVCP
jgi:hypothetical protein